MKDWKESNLKKMKKELDYYQIQHSPTWSTEFCGSLLLPEESKVTKVSGTDNWNASVLGSTPASSAKFRVSYNSDHEGRLMVGLSPKKGLKINGPNWDSCGWYLYVYSGGIFSKQHYDSMKKSKIPSGSVIEVTYDASEKTIRFSANEETWVVCVKGVHAKNLYPTAAFREVGTSVELLQ